MHRSFSPRSGHSLSPTGRGGCVCVRDRGVYLLVSTRHPLNPGGPCVVRDVQEADVGGKASRHPVDLAEVSQKVQQLSDIELCPRDVNAAQELSEVKRGRVAADNSDDTQRGDQRYGDDEAGNLQQHLARRLHYLHRKSGSALSPLAFLCI